ncbi:MAG: substrate-binding domain-containing protein [Chroococcales cyanobacterium]
MPRRKSKNIGEDLLREAGRRETNRILRRFFYASSFLQAKLNHIVPARLAWLLPWLEQNVDLPGVPTLEELREKLSRKKQKEEQGFQEGTEELDGLTRKVVPIVNPYPKYACEAGNPFICSSAQEALSQDPPSQFCSKCQFPALLPVNTKIRGSRGTYQIQNYLRARGRGRLYEAVDTSTRKPVIIQEYLLLDRYFNAEETKARKDSFVRIAGLELADGRVQDFRLIAPTEAIADPYQGRCYIVTKGNSDTLPTLTMYLEEKGAMTSSQVREFLNQTLQSLEFLHGQKFRLPSGLIQQGIVHGNIALHSILISFQPQGFFIYLSDLWLWENQFFPPISQVLVYSIAKDLADLGMVAFYLLAGTSIDSETGQPLDPRVDAHWPKVPSLMRDYIMSLCGFGMETFSSAEIARQTLLNLPLEPEVRPIIFSEVKQEEIQSPKSPKITLMVVAGVGAGLLALLSVSLVREFFPKDAIARAESLCCIKNVPGIPEGNYLYTTQEDSIWNYILKTENLIGLGETLEAQLEKKQLKLQLTNQAYPSLEKAIAAVIDNRAAFAITTLINTLPEDFKVKKIAYDGLVVFIPFTYSTTQDSLPQALNGEITFDQLRKIYTGEITNWQALGGPDLPVNLYIPTEPEAIRFFEERVLQDSESIAKFRELINNKPVNSDSNSFLNANEPNHSITSLQTFATLRQVIRDFEERKIGSISFGSLSKVFGQCSVYPLALKSGNLSAVSPLIQNNNKPVTPQTDLCNDKGSYSINREELISQGYPLSYPIAIVYPRDNSREPIGEKFAEVLRTTEAQRLLKETGVIPLDTNSDL